MPPKFNIITDSCCDLTKDYLEGAGVRVLHFTYTESGEPDGGLSGVDDLFQSRTAHEFYDAIRNGAKPMTSQPSPAEFDTVFREAIASGIPSVYLAFSSGISGCYEGAMSVYGRLVEEMGPQIPLSIVDLRIGSTPQALFITEAVRKRDAGMSAEEMVAWAESARTCVHTVFMVDDLVALSRGGRMPAAAAKIGALLGVKPLLSFALDGTLSMAGISRGRKKAMRRFVEAYQKAANHEGFSHMVALGNADCPQDMAALKALLQEVDPQLEFLETTIGPTIGCHVGPGMLSLCFWGASRGDSGQSDGGDDLS